MPTSTDAKSLIDLINLAQIAPPRSLDLAGVGPAVSARVANALTAELQGPIAPSPAAKRVYLLPGILGTTLTRSDDQRPLWIDAQRLVLEHGLAGLSGDSVGAGLLLDPVYGPLLTYLSLHGFEVVPWAFDWRHAIDEAATRLVADLHGEPAPVLVVGHSMGCLVARRAAQMEPALVLGPDARIERAVFVAPPFHGTFVPLHVAAQTFWASLLVGAVGYRPSEISRSLCGFTGFAELLPDPEKFPWPEAVARSAAGFSDDLLQHAAAFGQALRHPAGAAADADAALLARSSVVLCASRPTAVGVDDGGNFTWQKAGDDFVPAASAKVDGISGSFGSTWTHSFMPTDPAVWHGIRVLFETHGADGGFLPPDPTPEAGAVDARVIANKPPPDLLTLVNAELLRQLLSDEKIVGKLVPGPLVETLSALRDDALRAVAGVARGFDKIAKAAGLEGMLESFGGGGEQVRDLSWDDRVSGAGALEVDALLDAVARSLDQGAGRMRVHVRRRAPFVIAAGIAPAPDLAVYRWEREIPHLCVEVLTPDRAHDVRKLRLPLYGLAGVPFVWLVDPRERLVEVFHLRGSEATRVAVASRTDALPLPPFEDTVDLAAWWR